MSVSANILLVDDEPGMQRYIRTLLELDSYRVETSTNGLDALRRVQQGLSPDLVLLDMIMPGIDGLQTLEKLHEMRPLLPVVMLSCLSDSRKVVQAVRLGARDYLTKPLQKAALEAVIQQSLNTIPSLQGQVEEISPDGVYFVAACPAMRKLRAQAELVANMDIPLLFLGESGTGKEILARLIHKLSGRSDRTLLKVNCAAVPAGLLESELFGHEAGAFTGATHSKPGKFELCNKGTILLDEIGEMPPSLQAKLLQVLQDQQFSRLGGRSVVNVDVRILAATNVNIPQAIATRRLREDLYYRLNGFTFYLPPLRERKEEIPILLKESMSRLAERYVRSPLPLSPTLLDACLEYSWPGNLRELTNFVKRHLILADENIALSELRAKPQTAGPRTVDSQNAVRNTAGGLKSVVRIAKDEAETQAIVRALKQTRGHRKQAAALLKISYKALLYKVRQHNIVEPRDYHWFRASA